MTDRKPPEPLFPGLEWEWDEEEECYCADLGIVFARMGQMETPKHLQPGDWWWGSLGFFDTMQPSQKETIRALRARIIEHRDELCRVTGAVAQKVER